MECIIDGYDFFNMEAMKYYSVPVGWSEEKKKDNAMTKIFSGDWLGAQKRDGIFMMFCKDMDGNMYLRPRAKNTKGEFVNKIDWVPHLHDFFESIDPGTVFLGELYLSKKEEAKATTSIMNCLKEKAIARQKNDEDKLIYYIFDVLAENGVSYLSVPAGERFDKLNAFWRAYPHKYIEWAEYHSGKELWDDLQEILANGYEGVVITNKDALYDPGKRSSKISLKIKKELQDTIDCIVIGANPPTKEYNGKEIDSWEYWFNTQTNEKILASNYFTQNHTPISSLYADGAPVMPVTKNWFFGWAGSWKLGAIKDGKEIQIGNLSGLTDEQKENWRDYIDSVVEVSCMEIMESESGYGLRHPKLVSIRNDINKSDCTWERIFK